MREIYNWLQEKRNWWRSLQFRGSLKDSSLIMLKFHPKILVFWLFILPLFITNCSTSLKSYAKDRARDAADVFSVNLIYPAIGFKMDISGSSFGLHYTSYYSGNEAGSFGLRGGEFNTNTRTTDYTMGIGTGTFINGFPRNREGKIEHWFDPSEEDPSFYRRKRFKTGWDYPPYLYGRIGFTISCLIGIQFHYNFGEDLDLVLGWLGIDIFDDDMYSKLERDEKNASVEEANKRSNSYTKVDYASVLRSAQENFDSKNYQKASELAAYVVVNSNDSQLKEQAKVVARKAILRHSYQKAAEENSLGE